MSNLIIVLLLYNYLYIMYYEVKENYIAKYEKLICNHYDIEIFGRDCWKNISNMLNYKFEIPILSVSIWSNYSMKCFFDQNKIIYSIFSNLRRLNIDIKNVNDCECVITMLRNSKTIVALKLVFSFLRGVNKLEYLKETKQFFEMITEILRRKDELFYIRIREKYDEYVVLQSCMSIIYENMITPPEIKEQFWMDYTDICTQDVFIDEDKLKEAMVLCFCFVTGYSFLCYIVLFV